MAAAESNLPAHIRARGDLEAGDRAVSYPPAPAPLAVGAYDNHAHLEFADGDNPMDYREHLDMAGSVGVLGVIQVGTDVETSRWSAQLAHTEPRVLAAVAIHPNEAPVLHQAGELDAALGVIDELAGLPRVVAVGETGLDFFRTPPELHDAQKDAFRAHIEIAKKHGIALQIHDRDAHDAVVGVLLEVGAPERTVFHCFSGDAALAEVLAEHGWYASFAGTVSFKNSDGLRDALRAMPRSQILIETDTPFLTPIPYRGRPNSPYMIPYTLRSMAETLEMDENLLAAQLTDNTTDVYGRFDDHPPTQLGSVLRGR
ncbi:MAG: TatD family hydrolase [Microbacteriaceae bacterium]|jgi:TatD DNase family protein|nr:TatD family hydrolase [Microbacteriaceae bacterium]